MRSFTFIATLLLTATIAHAADIAVWDPQQDADDARFTCRAAQWDSVAEWLHGAGLPVVRLTYAQFKELGTLDPARFPVLVMSGHLLPLAAHPVERARDLRAYVTYLDQGGVILGLGGTAGGGLLGTAIEPKPAGGWALSPLAPRFAWETSGLREALGLRYAYRPALHNLGVTHRPTDLLAQYWPAAPVVSAQLPQVHHFSIPVGQEQTGCYALYDSLRVDGQPTVPAVFVARAGRRTAILENNPGWCAAAPASWFNGSKDLTIALARLALDLQAGRVVLPSAAKRDLPEVPAGVGPLRNRVPTGAVDPAGAIPVVRWGAFDGSNWELGEPATAGRVVDLIADAHGRLPCRLDPGARIVMPLPAHAGATWLRVRFAYTQDDAALVAAIDGRPVIAEQFLYVASTGTSNWGGDQLANQPTEISRCAFVPPGDTGQLVLTNPGRSPIWFDAMQLERRTTSYRDPVLLGWYSAISASRLHGAFTVPADSATYGALRCDARLQLLGPPDDPQRWAALDAIYDQYASYQAPLQMVFNGTPPWMAVPASLAEATRRKRPHICVPERVLYRQAIADWLARYGARFSAFELMNEVDITQFWIGTYAEYTTLCQDIIPLIRQHCPQARIIAAGSASQSLDLLRQEQASGMIDQIDWVAVHCYAAQSTAWELSAGLYEGHCFSLGIDRPIFANEQGFPWKNGEWFTDGWTPERQAAATDVALARLIAGGPARALLFAAGGDDHHFSYSDPNGKPRPGYQVVMDYNRLNGSGAQRVDPLMLTADGGLVRGTYCAASQWSDGTVVAVLNPCQGDLRPVMLHLLMPLPDDRPRFATLSASGYEKAVPLQARNQDGCTFADVTLSVVQRSILRISVNPQ